MSKRDAYVFVKKDYVNYFSQILDLEMQMKSKAAVICGLVKGRRARIALERILRDEKNHEKYIREILGIVENSRGR